MSEADSTPWAKSFEEFWPTYLGEHSTARLRYWHFVAILIALAAGFFVAGFSFARSGVMEALVLGIFSWLVVGYCLTMLVHFLVDGHLPKAPPGSKAKGQIVKELCWTIRADHRMFRLALREQLADELGKHGI